MRDSSRQQQVGRGTTTPRDRQAGRSLGKGGETPPVASHPVAAARHPDKGLPPSTRICERHVSVPEHIDEAAPASQAPAVINLPHLPPPADLAQKRKPKRQRQHVEQFRTDDAEHVQLVVKARAAGLSVGAYVRACALGDAGPRARRRATVDRELLAINNAALNRVGNNLNQIAKALNQGDDIDPFELRTTITELLAVLTANRRALGYGRKRQSAC
jgi:hypothetical protein